MSAKDRIVFEARASRPRVARARPARKDAAKRGKSGAKGASRDITTVLVRPEASLLEAMRAIDRGGIELAFVAERGGRIVGTLSDGDVRRAILAGNPLGAPNGAATVMHRKFTSVDRGVGRAEVLDRMRALGISAVPVLDGEGAIEGIHLLYELIGATTKPNAALIMAGGRGTRLGTLTQTVPKPMLPVAGRPILERLVLQLVGHGVRRIYLAINYLGHLIERHFGDGSAFGCSISYLREKKPLGSGGALSLLKKREADYPLVVMNGDLVTELDVTRLLYFHETGEYAVTMCLRGHQVQIPFGVAEVRGAELVALREKPQQDYLINAGVYVVSPHVVGLVPKRREFPMTELFDLCFARKLRVGAHVIDGDWLDVGHPEQLRRAQTGA
jgi:dTDP-glucose pyrophosphorylase/predicted transcriptional regulator